jgi:ribosomal protein S27AE
MASINLDDPEAVAKVQEFANLAVARSRKINLEKVLASLDKTCPKCGFTITPDLVKRLDFERMECPKCGEKFQPRAVK